MVERLLGSLRPLFEPAPDTRDTKAKGVPDAGEPGVVFCMLEER